ncbi:MAG: cyclase family protein [Gemmatimonadaceae bacterium]
MSERGIIDISVMLSPATPVWPGDTPFSCLWTWNISEGSSVNVSAVTASPHAGTHADTPLHVTNGAPASESLSLDAFRGPAVVIDVSDVGGEIQLADIHRQPQARDARRILLKTGRSIASGVFPESWPRLSVDCARELAQRGVLLVGTDCPSADDRESKTLDVHHALLDHGVCVMENLDLRGVEAGEYVLDALPMKVAGLDAAPVRAVLIAANGLTTA